MKLDYPYKTGNVEADATVVPRPGLPGCLSLPYFSTEGVQPNADIAATPKWRAPTLTWWRCLIALLLC
jgi:hypothetical protein